MPQSLVNALFNHLTMLPVLLSVITRALVTSDNCFGGVETFERIAVTDFEPNTVPMAGVLLQQDNVALTRDCINLCKQQQRCSVFSLNYVQFKCTSYVESSKRHRDHLESSKTTSLFEKICLKGISRQDFDHVCGNERLWAFERVKDTFLDGFVDKELTNMVDREECAKACLTESTFICRSADFDEVKRICRLSKENRRTQPQAFIFVKDSQRDYFENQCAPSGPASCVYLPKSNTNVHSMDSLQFATSLEDCQLQCDRETSFNCRAYGFHNNRCMLSGDDEKTIGKHPLVTLKESVYGERTCVAELCTNGIFTYEKITGHILRSAITTPVELPDYSSLGVTNWCRESCDAAQLNCPAFAVNYLNSRCERLDRNTQGRTTELIAKEGESYFEKICLRVPQIMSQCQDKFWAFERVLGYELAPVLYVKTLSFVQSRRDCQEYCLQEREFPCRSALYNDETTECRLSPEDRRTSPGHYYRSRSMKINYLENICVRIHSSCPYVKTMDAYPTYTDIVETNHVTSSEVCEKMCNDNRRFLCRSYAYYASNNQCFLSGDDSVSAGHSFIQKRSSIMYYERQCPKLFNTFKPNKTLTSESASLVDTTTDAYHSPESLSVPIDRYNEKPTAATEQSSMGIGNANKEIVIINGTVGGIITTKITRFPEIFSPTLPSSVTMDPHSSMISPNTGADSNQPHITSDINADSHFSTDLPSNRKCAPNSRFLFEKVTSFEPIGGHLTLLYTDLQNPGIVTECAKRCEHSSLCRAFVVDYYHQSCHGLFENSSVGLLDLRLSMGKDYFEGFCVPNFVQCNKFWPFDRIIDQTAIGVHPEEILRFISRSECRNRCLEEKKFRCLSTSYNSFTHECHLYSEDRNSGLLNLQFTKGIDFMENQCVIDVKSCRYHAIERDISIVSVTKSMRGTSTFHCEQACDYEKEFNCRSYTYLDNPDGSLAPGGNLCLLSADNRATSHQGSIQFRPRALYAEKDCVFHKSFPSYSKPSAFTFHSYPSNDRLDLKPVINSESAQMSGRQVDTDVVGPHQTLMHQEIVNETQLPQRYGDSYQTMSDIIHLQHILPRCSAEEYTFEKAFGFDLRYARRERAPISARPGVINYCRDECILRGEQCLAFVIEYGPNQMENCYFLDEAASENRNKLNKFIGTSYNEKICLRVKSCNSIWTFERVIGFTIDEPADKEIKSIMLRTACQDLCLIERDFQCRSITYDYGRRICRLFKDTKRSKPHAFKITSEAVDYFENKCVKEKSTCQYRDFNERYFNFVDRIVIASSLLDCQKQCDSELTFHCKSVNYDSVSRECSLSSEDHFSFTPLISNDTSSSTLNLESSILQPQADSIFSEKSGCEQVSVQCNQQDMMLTLNFDSPFHGRVYTKSNPSQCYVEGSGQTKLQSNNNYVNEVIVQQHSVIMTDNDRTIRVLCSFEISDQTITLGQAEQKSRIPVSKSGIDVTANSQGRSYNDRKVPATVVTNTVAPPSIVMRILDQTGRDAQVVNLGDDLTLRIELKDQKDSPFAMFARNLYARSSNGESLFLIDNNGCPIDASIFSALRLDPEDNKSLFSKFKAFRFPSTGVVNFEVQIRFCQDRCESIKCTQSDHQRSNVNSFGRRKRSVENRFIELLSTNISSHNNQNINNDNFKSTRTELWDSNNKTMFSIKLNAYGKQNHMNQETENNFSFNFDNQNRIKNNESLVSKNGQLESDPNKNDGFADNSSSFKRTQSSKFGFTYPSENYLHYRSNSSFDKSFEKKPITLFKTSFNLNNNHNKHEAPNNEFKTQTHIVDEIENENKKAIFSLKKSSSDDILTRILKPKLSTEMKKLQKMENSIHENLKHHSTIPNSVLPLPTSATEVPLSLAIMVDEHEMNDNNNQNKIENDIEPSNSFSDHTINYKHVLDDDVDDNDKNLNFDSTNDQWNSLNFPDMAARLEIKNDFRHTINDKTSKSDANLHSICNVESCSNTGIVIFLTTLIVTIVHLTLGATVYLYICKLKKFSKKKSIYCNPMMSPHLIENYQTPSSSSTSSTLGLSDSFSLNEETTLNSVVSSNDKNNKRPQTQLDFEYTKPTKWFGIDDEQFGSIRSKFNRENIFFGPKEQRFFGINNYAFSSSNRSNFK